MQEHVKKLADHHILVIGDIILDEYLIGQATRMSREAPVPVLEFEQRRLIPGGAANPAANIAALGSHPTQIGIVGDDTFAVQLREVIQAKQIDDSGIITDASRHTTVKTRIMAQMGLRFPQQVARLDRLTREPISAAIEAQIKSVIQDKLPTATALLFSDYHTGLITPTLVDQLRDMASDHILTADAQGELDKYAGFTLVKCNADEAQTYLNRPLTTDTDFAKAARDLYQRLALKGAMAITRGGDGMTIATADDVIHAPAPSVSDVYDTVGAGDTTIAVLTLALAGSLTYAVAASLANYASGLVVRRVGNYTPSPQELEHALTHWS